MADERVVDIRYRSKSTQPKGILKPTPAKIPNSVTFEHRRRTIKSKPRKGNEKGHLKNPPIEKAKCMEGNVKRKYDRSYSTNVPSKFSTKNMQEYYVPGCPCCQNGPVTRSHAADLGGTLESYQFNPNLVGQNVNNVRSSYLDSSGIVSRGRSRDNSPSRNAIQLRSRPQTPPARPLHRRQDVFNVGNSKSKPQYNREIKSNKELSFHGRRTAYDQLPGSPAEESASSNPHISLGYTKNQKRSRQRVNKGMLLKVRPEANVGGNFRNQK